MRAVKKDRRPERKLPLQGKLPSGLCSLVFLFSPAYSAESKEAYLIFVTFLSFKITSWAPPSTMLVAETRVIFAFFCSSGMVRAPQLHMVDFTLLRVRLTLSFKLPAYAT